MEQNQAEKPSKRLKKISYSDKEIRLECYADTLVYRLEADRNSKKRTLAAIRFGGYPEQVKAMSDAIYGGGTIETDIGIEGFKFECMTKRYTRNLTMGEIYAEATLFAVDEATTPVSRGKNEEQEKLDAPPRKLYIFCNENDSECLFEEIGRQCRQPYSRLNTTKTQIMCRGMKAQFYTDYSVICRWVLPTGSFFAQARTKT